MAPTPLLHDIPTVVEMLGLSRTTVYDEIKAGRLATVKIGRRTMVKHSELERFVEVLPSAA
ncbi:helix-turn-helix domain-containing protein [Microbacterium lacticum]|uniref:helix-turn-helix domain-containing protein n=1 Tax=Microbacterium lacticum TaxID=33885 RepID=UPI0018B05D0D|nr:helix-turn-helix domain-containing protein [Microbacterium lacticum]MBF9335842.1 helix-turn-helix domain-containing protein [Microbacterium lacticum]